MITAKTARMLTRYNTWSNKVWYDALVTLPPGEAEKPRTSLFKNMIHTMNHIYIIDLIWQHHLEGLLLNKVPVLKKLKDFTYLQEIDVEDSDDAIAEVLGD